jgi:hypothetical protein
MLLCLRECRERARKATVFAVVSAVQFEVDVVLEGRAAAAAAVIVEVDEIVVILVVVMVMEAEKVIGPA